MANPEINLTPTATLLAIDPLAGDQRKQKGRTEQNGKEPEKQIPCRSWGIASESSAAFLLIHGLGAHSGWFEAIGRRLKVKQLFVLAPDLTGFGKRKGEHYFSYQQWLKDVEAVFAQLQLMIGDKPIYLLGNSMGALVALEACRLVKPSGLVLLSPAFAGHPKIFTLSYQLPELFKALTNRDQELDLPYSTDLITRSEQVKAWLDSDIDKRMSVPGKMLLDLLFLTQSLRWRKISLNCPLFMLTAGMDGLVDNQVSEMIFRQINSPSKKRSILNKAAHDLTLEPDLDELVDLLIDWTNGQSKTGNKFTVSGKTSR